MPDKDLMKEGKKPTTNAGGAVADSSMTAGTRGPRRLPC
jgi:hypothetical protein